jgi:hypothetical protein
LAFVPGVAADVPTPIICALCLTTARLCNSHIIPEFMFSSIYDEKHRFHTLTIRKEGRNRMEQKGIRQPLLCQSCESRFSKLEDYASDVFRGSSNVKSQLLPNSSVSLVTGFDYSRFKLFQLSILWRASVATSSFFKEVDLGPHEEPIRSFLLSGNPGPSNRYACLMWRLLLDDDVANGFMMPPTKHKTNGRIHYTFVFGGFLWNFHVSNQPMQSPLDQIPVKEDGTALIDSKSIHELVPLARFAEILAEMGRNPKQS